MNPVKVVSICKQSIVVLFIISAKQWSTRTEPKDHPLLLQIPDNGFLFPNVYMYDLGLICVLTDQSGSRVPAEGEQQWGCWVSC